MAVAATEVAKTSSREATAAVAAGKSSECASCLRIYVSRTPMETERLRWMFAARPVFAMWVRWRSERV